MSRQHLFLPFTFHIMLTTRLPLEILVEIASYLRRQSDILALLLTSRHLHHVLINSLYRLNCRRRQASALRIVAGQGNVQAVQRFLETLTAECARGLESTVWEEIDTTDDENEETWKYVPERRYSSVPEVKDHPLKAAGYRIAHIVQIQMALLAAIRGGHKEIVTMLLDHGARVNFYCGAYQRPTRGCGFARRLRGRRATDPPPLYLAVKHGHEQLVELLLERGADPDMYKPCPLYRAVDDERYDIIEMLLKHGAINQESSLKLAALKGNLSMLRFLLDNGARADEEGHSALYVATRKDNQEMIDLLRSKGARLQSYTGPEGISWNWEDGDGFLPPKGGPVICEVICYLDDSGVDEEDEEEEEAADE